MDCSCTKTLNSTNPGALCDGYADCASAEDELYCLACPENGQFLCKESRECLNKSSVCNGINDCASGEDERHCLMLVPSGAVSYDPFSPTPINMFGFLMVNMRGTWHKVCMDQWDGSAANLACRKLNFAASAGVIPKPMHREDNVATHAIDRTKIQFRLAETCREKKVVYMSCEQEGIFTKTINHLTGAH